MSDFQVGERIVYNGADKFWRGVTGTFVRDDGQDYIYFYPDRGVTYSDGFTTISDMYRTGKGAGMERDGFERIEKSDPVAQPAHYKQGGIECIDAIRAALTPEEFRGYCKGNMLKYAWRERHKNGDEDLRKAAVYSRFATEACND